MKILLIEDEPKVSSFIKEGLEEECYEVEVAFDGQMGKRLALKNDYDFILLDIIIPYINGIELCKEIRKTKPEIPILMLTALGTIDDKMSGFDVGADDYLVKPFEFKELLARIRAIVNRTTDTKSLGNTLKVADLIMDLDEKTVYRCNIKIELTAREFNLLELFIRNKNRVLSRTEISEKVWDINFDTRTNIVDVYVNYLRNKVDRDFAFKLINTQIGFGYVLKEE
jgi:two-component system, OmpR family, copper resistance phosphate regulon response regulator CusR